jgi:hypothetical protein
MNRLSKLLTLVLALQLLLVLAVFWPRSNETEDTANSALLILDTDSVNRVAISDADNSVILERSGDDWRLPEYHGLPVDMEKLPAVLKILPGLSRGWPLANSSNAQTRFEVAPDKFQRRVDYMINEQSTETLLVGTSPGFRQVHVRAADTDPIYSVKFNSFDLPVQAAEWLDKTLLQVADVQAVSGLDYSIRRDDEGWQGDGELSPDAAEVEKLLNGLKSLRVTGAADIAMAAILEDMQVPPTLTVETAAGDYEFRLFEVDDTYYINRADIGVHFNLSALDYDRLNEVTAASLQPQLEAQ